MQFPTILALLGLAATSVLAQDLSTLPTCAQACFTDNLVNSACASTDIACLCGDSTYFTDVEVCVLGACSTDDVVASLNWATATCDAAGVPLRKKRSVFGRKY